MFYDRKVKYLDYMENGEKIRGAGFVKAEVRDQVCRMQICVKGLHATDHFEKQVLMIVGKQESLLCKIKIEGGRGTTGEMRLDAGHMGRGDIPYEQLEEIRIPVAAGKEIRCLWQKKEEEVKKRKEIHVIPIRPEEYERAVVFESEKERSASESEFEAEATAGGQFFEPEMEEKDSESEADAGAQVFEPEMEEPSESEVGAQVFETEIGAGTQTIASEEEEKIYKREVEAVEKETERDTEPSLHLFPLDDKWKQLESIYPHVTPFEDEREYLSLGPGDFVIFPSRYYRVVNNSFLLHGFHNYQHLILARMESRGEIRYYVGVPGNYYEKEKQVALMFGFESFECKQEPARSGDYGYYMMRVEL